ncbi:ABC-2 family transporter protein [Bacteriovoracaceae bacterium]|nr:ABC-2 family transporter protein [Bacteriovoracaceae bacterium]
MNTSTLSFRAYFSYFLMEIRRIIAYKSDFYINFLGVTIISFFISYSLWQSIFAFNGLDKLNGMTFNYLIYYSLIAPLSFRIIQGHQIGFLSREIYEGDINKYLIYPVSLIRIKFSSYIAQSMFYFIQLFLLLFIINFLGISEKTINVSIQSVLVYAIFLFITTVFYYLTQAIIECIAFWADNIWSLAVLLRMTVAIFSGAIIPLNLFPAWSLDLLNYTPFPYLTYLPIKILFGNSNSLEILKGILILLAWSIPISITLKAVLKKGLKNYNGIGM